MSIFYMPRPSSYGQNLKPFDGAKLRFFTAGTTTPKASYTTSAESVANAVPVVADANGRFTAIYISGLYKATLHDKNDVLIWTEDNLQGRGGDVNIQGDFDSSTNGGDYPLTGSQGTAYMVTTGFTLNSASGSHILQTGDMIYANKDGASPIDADWNIIRGQIQNNGVIALTDAANIATNCELGTAFTVTLTDNRTLDNPTNKIVGQSYTWQITQDAGGTNTLAFGTDFDFAERSTIDLDSNAITVIRGVTTASGVLRCNMESAKLIVDSVVDSTSTVTGSIQTDGGIGAAKAIFAGGKITTSDATTSTTSTTGSLIVGGGAGIAENLNVGGNAIITGDFTVNGTTTTIDTTTLVVEDKNIEMGAVTTPSDTTADGGGITLKGSTDKTLIWDNANDNWTANQDVNVPTGKVYKINNVDVVDVTQTLTNKTLTTPTITTPVINVTSDAQGDIYYRDGSGNFVRLAPGTAGQFLSTQGAAANPAWASHPRSTIIRLDTSNGYGSTDVAIPKYTNITQAVNNGTVVTVANSATLGTTVTAVLNCLVYITRVALYNGAGINIGMSYDALGSDLTAGEKDGDPTSLTPSQLLTVLKHNTADIGVTSSFNGLMSATDIIRPQDSPGSTIASSPARSSMSIIAIEIL